MSEDPEVLRMAVLAHARGIATPEQVTRGLEEIIKANNAYINQPHRRGKPFNLEIERRNQVIAAAIVLLDSRDV